MDSARLQRMARAQRIRRERERHFACHIDTNPNFHIIHKLLGYLTGVKIEIPSTVMRHDLLTARRLKRRLQRNRYCKVCKHRVSARHYHFTAQSDA